VIKLVLLALLGWLAWRFWKSSQRPSPSQARALLEIGEDAGPDEIRAAHRRLLLRVHPDAGGSAELTRRVNEARDILIATRRDAGR
jgi:DnaJ homolog subfamily C member 19